MPSESEALAILDAWYQKLPPYQDKLPAKGAISAALFVLDRLRDTFDLNIASHVSGGEEGAQITGLSGKALKMTLAKFGEHRELSAIGGRSNRGTRAAIAPLLNALRNLHLEQVPTEVRDKILESMQRKIAVEYVPLYFKVKRVKAIFDPADPTSKFIQGILENADSCGKAGAVAEYLVGAKLAIKFPGINVRNKRFSSADVQSGHSGDFEIGNTVFHVTVAPMYELLEKCRKNLEQGYRVYILVPRGRVEGARQNVDSLNLKVAVEPIESFVATNLDEQSSFEKAKLVSGLHHFLLKYNQRVDEVELDKSLLIDIPPNLE
jgi:hypothetical protein